MKKTILFAAFICSFFAAQTSKAQDPVTTLQHAGTTKVFYGTTSFSDAYTTSVKGDTLLLSIGGFTPPAAIAKGITVIGSGHFPDSVTVKKRTTILGGLTFNAGADSLHLEGLYINGSINSAMVTIHNIKINRCRVVDISFSSSGSAPKNNCLLEDNFIEGNINFSNNGNNFIVRHNVIASYLFYINSNAIIDGNVFLSVYGGISSPINSSIIRNNIFIGTNGANLSDPGSNNVFYNNLLKGSAISYSSGSSGSSNYFGVAQANIFINQTGNVIDYSHNYHLKSPISYIGTDGTQVGLYGGLIPFKDGGVPSNPQITSKSVDTKTDTNGNLKINFTVKAQDN